MARPPIDPGERERRLDEVLAAYLQAVAVGRGPDRQELIAGLPELADELRAFFADYDRLHRLVDPLQPAARAAQADVPATEPTSDIDETDALAEPAAARGLAPTLVPDHSAGELTTDWEDGGVPANGDEGELPRGTQVRYFGDYELRHVLGRGGMGVVYRARQLSLNRSVAVKMIRAGLWASDDELRRFRNEAEAVATLDHPRIVTIHEVGQFQGHHYFSMRLVEGPSLDQRLDQYVADPRRAAQLVAEVARAVHHAHQRGILHRDLKPSNILLDGEGHPHVTDFGLARRLEGNAARSVSGSIVGTPQYMSPEQASGSRQAITTATDVYGLGALLYAALTGQPPFQSDSVLETLQSVREKAPTPPSKRNRKVPRDLEVICLKCLEKDPRRRYGSADALADELERFVRGEPILARRTSAPERLIKWARRRPAIATLAMALIASTAIGFGGVVWQLRATQRARAAENLANVGLRKSYDDLEAKDYVNRLALARTLVSAPSPKIAEADALLEGCPVRRRGWEWHYLRRLGHPRRLASLDDIALWIVAYSPDFRRFATLWTGPYYAEPDTPGVVTIWDADTRTMIREIPYQTYTNTWHFSSDGRYFAVCGRDEKPPPQAPLPLEFDGSVTLWDTTDGQTIARMPISRDSPMVASHGVLSPDGRHWAMPRKDRSLAMWDFRTRRLLYTDAYHGPSQTDMQMGGVDIVFGPSGSLVAYSPTARKSWRILQADSGKLLHELGTESNDPANSLGLAFSLDGRRLVAVEIRPSDTQFDSTLSIRDAESGRLEVRVSDKVYGFHSAFFSPDGRRVVASGFDVAVILDAGTGQELLSLRTARNDPSGFSADGHYLIGLAPAIFSTLLDGTPYDEANDPEVLSIPGHDQAVFELAFSPDGRVLASRQGGGRIRLWDVAGGWSEILTIEGQRKTRGGLPGGMTFSQDSRLLYMVQDLSEVDLDAPLRKPDRNDDIGRVIIRDAATGRRVGGFAIATEGRFPGQGWSISMSRDGRRIAVAGDLGPAFGCRIFDPTSGAPIATIPTENIPWYAALSPVGNKVAFGGRVTGKLADVLVHDAATGKSLYGVVHAGFHRGMAFSPDGAILATATIMKDNCDVKLWDATSGAPIRTLRAGNPDPDPINTGSFSPVCFSPDGRTLAAGANAMVGLWDVATGRQLRTFQMPSGDVHALAFHPDGSRLAIGGGLVGEGELKIWDVALSAGECNDLALACLGAQEEASRHPERAIELARRAVELAPRRGDYWGTLGFAHYRSRDWNACVAALEKAMPLSGGIHGDQYFVLSMALWQGGEKDRARGWHDRARRWYRPIEQDSNFRTRHPERSEFFRRLADEAGRLLGEGPPTSARG